MDEIPPPMFIIAGIGIAVYSAFIGLKTDFIRFIFFFAAAAALIAWGVIQTLLAGGKKQNKSYTPPANPYAGKNVPFDRRLLDQPLPDPNYPRPESFTRGQGFEQYTPPPSQAQQYAPQQLASPNPYEPQPQYAPQNPQQYAPYQPQQQPVRRYRGFYQNQATVPNKSRFHDRVRQK